MVSIEQYMHKDIFCQFLVSFPSYDLDLDEVCWQHPVLVQIHTGKNERSIKKKKILIVRLERTGEDPSL